MTLLASYSYTGADGSALPAGHTVRSGAIDIESNAAKCAASGAPHCFILSPSRGNDIYSISWTIVDRSVGTVKGMAAHGSNGSTTTSNGVLAGCDDSGNANIWTLANGVATAVATAGWYGALDGTLTLTVTKPATHYVYTLTTSVDGSTLSWTDATDVFVAGGDIRFVSNGNLVAVDNVAISGTAAVTGRAVTETILDGAGAPLVSTSINWFIRQTFNGVVTDSGTAATNGSGILALTNLAGAAGAATLFIKNASDTNFAAPIPVTLV